MFDPEERFYLWQEYEEAIKKIFVKVDDDLFYDLNQDKDVPNVKKLRDALELIHERVKAHLQELEEEYSAFDTERSNLSLCFRAWEKGLCPKVMRQVCPFDNDGNDVWGIIASLRKSPEMSYENTRQAVDLWRKLKNYPPIEWR